MKRLVVVILILLLGAVGIIFVMNSEKDIEKEIEDSKVEDAIEDIIVEEPAINELQEISIVSNDGSKFGISTSSTFTLTTKEITKSDLMRNLIIEPKTDFSIEMLNEGVYLITPKLQLLKNKVYKFKYDKLDYSKAFQTSDDLRIYSSYPGNDVSNVPLKTFIEIEFNGVNIKNIEENFVIEPKVNGNFLYEINKVIFEPEALEKDTNYIVTIKKGVTSGERILKEDYIFSFNTGITNFNNSRETFTLMNVIEGTNPIISTNNWGQSEEYNVKILRANSFDIFRDSFKHFIKYQNKNLDLSNYTEVFSDKLEGFSQNYRDYIELPLNMERGNYLVQIIGEGVNYSIFMQVGKHQIYYMKTNEEELFWIVDSLGNKNVDNGEIFLEQNKIGMTGTDGVLVIENINNESNKEYVAKIDDYEYLIKTFDSMYNYHGYDYWSPYNEYSYDYWSFLYTDRTVYLNTDEINIFTFARSYDGKNIKNAKILLSNYWGGDVILEQEINLVSGESNKTSLKIEDIEGGEYLVTLIINDKYVDSSGIRISSYEKPEILLTSTINKKIIYSGEEVELVVKANYFNNLPYKNFEVNFGTGNYYNYVKDRTLITDNNGIASIKINPVSDSNQWRPERYTYAFINKNSEDTILHSYNTIAVVSRDVMVNVKTKRENDIGNLIIETNNIDISKYDSSYNYDSIKGDAIDRDIIIKIIEITYDKIFVEKVYDKLHKVSYDKYDYVEKQTALENVKLSTIDGIVEYKFPVNDQSSYKIEVITYDKKNEQIVESAHISSSYRPWRNYDERYELKVENREYLVGDTVKSEILEYKNSIDESVNDKSLFLIMRNGLIDYKISENAKFDFEFLSEYRPNVLLNCVYFDSNSMVLLPKYGNEIIGYHYDELEVSIEAETDKNSYVPGELVKVNINVKDIKGENFTGDINISVVDEAYFSLYDNYFNIGNELHSFVYSDGVIYRGVSSIDDTLLDSMAEGGGGEMEILIRDDFPDLAAFEIIKIVDGHGIFEFNVPDNLTKWRLTIQAINEDLNYGKKEINLNVGLPYFIRTIYNTKYNTNDEVYLSVKSDGLNFDGDTKVNYNINLNRNNNIFINTEEGIGYDFTNINVGVLDKGEYELTITGVTENGSDGIKEKLTVSDSYMKFDFKLTEKVDGNFKIDTSNGDTSVKFYNEEARKYSNLIYRSFTYDNSRVEEILARFGAYEIIKENFDNSRKYLTYEVSDYQSWDGGIKGLLTGNTSTDITSLILGTGFSNEYINKDNAINYLYDNLNSTSISLSGKAKILWALAKQNEPILLGINEFIDSNNIEKLNDNALLYISLALLDIGESNRGKDIGELLIKNVDEYKKNVNYKEFLLVRTLARRIKSDKLNDFNEYIENSLESRDIDTYGLEEIYDLFYYKPKFDDTYLEMDIDGEIKKISLPGTSYVNLDLEKDSVLKLNKLDGNIYAVKYFKVLGTDREKYDSDVISIEKKYLEDKIYQNDLVEVKLTISKPLKSSIEVFDIIPAGFEFAGIEKNQKRIYLDSTNTNKIKFNVYKRSEKVEIVYYISAVQVGKYNTEGAAVMIYYNEELNFSDSTVLRVFENE